MHTILWASLLLASAPAWGQGRGEEARNSRLVGSHDLQARSAYQPLPVRQGDRWLLYVGHHAGEKLNPLTGGIESNGTSIVDVTDPERPRFLHHIPPSGSALGAQMVQVCSGDVLPAAEEGRWYLLRANGNRSHEIWDVTVPDAPTMVSTVVEVGRTPDGQRGTHKSWWDCASGTGYLVGSKDGWRAVRILQVFDLSDPLTPRHIRDFSLVGVQPGATGNVPGGSGIHEPTLLGDRVFLAYGTATDGVIQIVDRTKLVRGDPSSAAPLDPSETNLLYPQIGRLDLPGFWGAHTAFPLLGIEIADYADNRDLSRRDFLVVTSEAMANQCQEVRHSAFIIDITEPERPFSVASFQVPEASGDFCERGGRFGPHAPQWSMDPPFYGRLMIFSWFNAGARVVDVRDPFHPREVAYYIPATTSLTDVRCARIGGVESCKTAIQTNNVEVDERGLIYLVDRADTGLHIVELTGEARQVLDSP